MAVVVWLKRDLRVADHAPLAAAAASGEPALALFVIEPAWLGSPEFDAQHLAFALQSLAPLRRELAARGLPLLVRTGPMVDVLQALHREVGIRHLLSHEETGPGWTYTATAPWPPGAGEGRALAGVAADRRGAPPAQPQRLGRPLAAPHGRTSRCRAPSGWRPRRLDMADLPTRRRWACTPRRPAAAGRRGRRAGGCCSFCTNAATATGVRCRAR
jgi:deoxyribodipyrimidine photo-lyase